MPGFEWIDEEEKNAVASIFDEGGVLLAHGFDKLRKRFHVREFETRCREHFGPKHCLAVSSGTAAIKVALKSVGVGFGDEVVTQAFNFIATVEAILDCGAVPVIANIDENLNMDVEDLRGLISPRTKAIMPVHMLGVSARMKQIMAVATEYGLPVVEDSCEAIGATYDGKPLGTLGDVGVLSFDQGKMIATGEGGMLLTDNAQIYEYSQQYHDHGHENNPNLPRGRDTKTRSGFNYRMTEMQAAVGKVQLKKLDQMLVENKYRYQVLERNLADKFLLREIPTKAKPNWDTFILFEENTKKRQKIINLLLSENFGTKNLPDAMEWHCAAFWDHALPKDQISNSQKSLRLLESAIAIPIWLRRTVEDYQGLARKMISL